MFNWNKSRTALGAFYYSQDYPKIKFRFPNHRTKIMGHELCYLWATTSYTEICFSTKIKLTHELRKVLQPTQHVPMKLATNIFLTVITLYNWYDKVIMALIRVIVVAAQSFRDWTPHLLLKHKYKWYWFYTFYSLPICFTFIYCTFTYTL